MGFFRTDGKGWTCAGGCDSARVKPGVAQVVCRGGQRSVTHPIREYEGEILTDYYFGEANTANKSDKLHNNAINKNLNWGGFPGCYSSLPPTEDLLPRSRTIQGGRGGEGEARDDEELNTTNKEHDSMSNDELRRDIFSQRDGYVGKRSHRC